MTCMLRLTCERVSLLLSASRAHHMWALCRGISLHIGILEPDFSVWPSSYPAISDCNKWITVTRNLGSDVVIVHDSAQWKE